MNPIHRRYFDARNAYDENPCEANLSELESAKESVLRDAQRKKPLIGHCKDCKWWSKRSVFGECSHKRIARFNSPKCCDVQVRDRMTGKTVGLTVIVTRPDFGCVLFEAK